MTFEYDENLGQGRYKAGFYDKSRKVKFFPYSGDRDTSRYILDIDGFDQMYVVIFEEDDRYNFKGRVLGDGKRQITDENREYIRNIIHDALIEEIRNYKSKRLEKARGLKNKADLEQYLSQFNYEIFMQE